MEKKNRLPKGDWCVKNDGSKLFIDTVIKYINTLESVGFAGKLTEYFYGETNHRGNFGTSPWGTELTIQQFINLTTEPMEDKMQIKINIPEGCEIDRENSTFENIVLKRALPTKWENIGIIIGFVINSNSMVVPYLGTHSISKNKYVWPTKEYAQAALAMSQLLQFRQTWIGDWKPDWKEDVVKYCIYSHENKIVVNVNVSTHRILSFPTVKMAEDFKTAFKELLKEAAPLL